MHMAPCSHVSPSVDASLSLPKLSANYADSHTQQHARRDGGLNGRVWPSTGVGRLPVGIYLIEADLECKRAKQGLGGLERKNELVDHVTESRVENPRSGMTGQYG